MRMPKRKRKPVASDGSEKLVLDQCALFALQRAVSAVQDREVSSQYIHFLNSMMQEQMMSEPFRPIHQWKAEIAGFSAMYGSTGCRADPHPTFGR